MKHRTLSSSTLRHHRVGGAIWENDPAIKRDAMDVSHILSNLNLRVGNGIVRI